MSKDYKDYEVARGGELIRIKKLSEYEELPVEPGTYWVIGQVLDVGDRVYTGQYSSVIQTVFIDHYGQPMSLRSFNKNEIDKLIKSGHAEVFKDE